MGATSTLARFEELIDRAIAGDDVALEDLPDVARAAWAERCASWSYLTGRLHEVVKGRGDGVVRREAR